MFILIYPSTWSDNITHRHLKYRAIDKLNSEATEIANSLGIGDRMQKFHQNQAFCSIKDHKTEFDVTNPNSVKRRLINPAKSDIGVVSLTHLTAPGSMCLYLIRFQVCVAGNQNVTVAIHNRISMILQMDIKVKPSGRSARSSCHGF